MMYRKLDENGDMVFGHSLKDYWRDVPEAPAQAIGTRLRLWQGEWFLNTTAGTPYNTQVLGKYTGGIRDAVIRQRVLGTTGIVKIISYSSALNRETREFTVTVRADTQYGEVLVKGPI